MLLFKKKGHIFQDSSRRGYLTTTTTSRAPKSRRGRRWWWRTRGGGGGGSAVGSSMPIFLLTTSKVLSIFLLAPRAATPCASSAYTSISTISFQDIPSKFGVYLCSLSDRRDPATSLSTPGSKSSSSFFAPPPLPPLLFPPAADEPLLPLALRPGERPPVRPGPR